MLILIPGTFFSVVSMTVLMLTIGVREDVGQHLPSVKTRIVKCQSFFNGSSVTTRIVKFQSVFNGSKLKEGIFYGDAYVLSNGNQKSNEQRQGQTKDK